MNIPFWKMHGAGNDFILVDDRSLSFPAGDRAWLRRLCARRDGVGAEGVILLQPSARADVRMRFFNPDGSDAAMCGNGARCVARLALDLGAAPAAMRLETDAGEVSARVSGESVRLGLTEPRDIRLEVPLDVPKAGRLAVSLVTVGVPHAVVWVADLEAADVAGWGSAIRHHPALAPAGANADFAAIGPGGLLAVRTYERGVEQETLACGTGMAACAVAAVLLGRAAPPVRVRCRHGDTLAVDLRVEGGRVRGLTLEGPACHVFTGVLAYPGPAGA